ncbi:MAG: hypothetical protein FWE66_01315 [Oscillospiraceae bacterium]|nr:hypothetical protein [Oscillospiraceae bacterium]
MTKNTERAASLARTDLQLRGMSGRIKAHFDVLEAAMHKKQIIWGGEETVITSETATRDAVVRRSLAFERCMLEIPIEIEPYALLAGNCAKDGVIVRCMLPKFILEEELGLCTLAISHKCPDYETLLAEGLSGILAKLDEKEAAARESGAMSAETDSFCEAVRREIRAVISLSHRYADLAEEKAEIYTTSREELLGLAEICRRVPEFPAKSFHEALQSLWFLNHALRESMTSVSIGHIDRLLNPYFESDYEAGRISLARAQELIDAFNLRVNERTQIDPKIYVVGEEGSKRASDQFKIGYSMGLAEEAEDDEADAINHWGQNILISGLRADGSDGTNALTYMFLNAHEKFRLTNPVLTVRMHKNSPPELYGRVAEVLKTGGGMPFINNDDVIVGAYEKLGVPRADACEYANSNCWETLIQGKSNQEMIRFVNFLYLLELVLNRGKSTVYAGQTQAQRLSVQRASPWVCPSNPVTDTIDTGDPAAFTCLDDIIDAWTEQLDFMLEESMSYVADILRDSGSHGPLSSNPLLSALTRDCIAELTDITHGGARYDLWHLMGEAVSNAADALSAIQTFVFEQKLLTLSELIEILNEDWESNEQLKQRFFSDVPRFGNGMELPDGIAKRLVDIFVERAGVHAKEYTECIFSPCIGTFSWIISIGKRIGASADGRSSRDPIAANMSPVPGTDLSGPTAAIISYLKLNTKPMAAGAPLDLRINSKGLEGEEGTKRVEALVKTFIEMGGNMLTLTITSAEDLKRAIAEPEKYRSLRVRMGGWTAYFTLLSKQSQSIHLKRVEHGL